MKKIILLFAMMLAVGTVSAIDDKTSSFGTPGSNSAYGNIYTWKDGTSNLVQLFSGEAGFIKDYTHLHFILNKISAGSVRIYVKCGTDEKSTQYYTAEASDKNVEISTSTILPTGKSVSDITQISFGGSQMGTVKTDLTDDPGTTRANNYAQIDLSSVYLSGDGKSDLYATVGSPASNATYTSNTLAWKDNSDNLMDMFSLSSSEVANYTTLKFNIASLTKGSIRVGYYVGEAYTGIGAFYSDGDKTVDLLSLGVDPSTITRLVIGGNSISDDYKYSYTYNGTTKSVLKGIASCLLDPTKVTLTNDALSRTFTVNQKSTVCLPFALTKAEREAAGTFYELTAFDGSTLTFTEVTGESGIDAYKPYVFKASSTSPFSGLTKTCESPVGKTTDGTCQVSVGSGSNTATFHGVLKSGIVPDKAYGYNASNGNFSQANGENAVSIDAFRAYITVTTAGEGATARLNVIFDDETTGIETMNREPLTVNQTYNLSGQRVSQPTKGLYIVNGKKVVVK